MSMSMSLAVLAIRVANNAALSVGAWCVNIKQITIYIAF